MGVDLKLLVCDCGDKVSFTQLECNRDYQLHEEILREKPFERPEVIFYSYNSTIPDGSMKGERCFGETIKTPYGERITYLRATQLTEAFQRWFNNKDNYHSQFNSAIHLFLKNIDPNMFVALFWH